MAIIDDRRVAAERLVADVAARSFGACFCMLRDEDPELDAPGAADVRRANLITYVLDRTRQPPVLLVGEAMGYNGGRFSGIAFTSERTLLAWGPPYAPSSRRPGGYAEQSGSIVHGLLRDLDAEHDALLWNVVPAHPNRPGRPLSNRTPTAAELQAGLAPLRAVIALARPRALVAVGRSAERALRELGVEAQAAVRHPANAGATAFRAGAAAVFRAARSGELRAQP